MTNALNKVRLQTVVKHQWFGTASVELVVDLGIVQFALVMIG